MKINKPNMEGHYFEHKNVTHKKTDRILQLVSHFDQNK